MERLVRGQFPVMVTELVRNKFPLVEIAPIKEKFAVSVNGNMASLENLYRIAASNPAYMRYHVNRWMVELLRAGEGAPDEGGSFDVLKDRILPMVQSSDDFDLDGDILSQPLISGLVVAYAIDNDRTIAYLSKRHFRQWGVPIDTVQETALANLVAKSQAMSAHAAQDETTQLVNMIIFQQMDGYDASRILLPSLHEKLREHLGSPFVAALPNRDILLCFRDDEATCARLRPQIEQDYRKMPHQLSKRLFLITSDGIAPK